jgi:hypothetical protein
LAVVLYTGFLSRIMRWLKSTLLTAILSKLCTAAPQPFSEGDDPLSASVLNVPTPAPVIGVLSQPGGTGEYIAASYVKWVEAGGAQVVPVFSDSSEDELSTMFSKLNGLLVPGAPIASVGRLFRMQC